LLLNGERLLTVEHPAKAVAESSAAAPRRREIVKILGNVMANPCSLSYL
jgi:hypothetical protein